MTERPIIFDGHEVRALLDGTKTQTRRIIQPQPVDPYTGRELPAGARPESLSACPFGAPGDRLWVRETWKPLAEGSVPGWVRYGHAYQADGAVLWNGNGGKPCWVEHASGKVEKVGGLREASASDRWRPSIHMPRRASRITLEVTGVRVERLCAISEDDAMAEGVGPAPFCRSGRAPGLEHIEAFAELWESINGADSWAANPWVWVVTFKRVTP